MSNNNEFYNSLLKKHQDLENNIRELYKNFGNEQMIKELKAKKLSLKELLAALEQDLSNKM